ncbi:MAG: hypothetical protein HYS07_09565 [Chlamydiae bacterium]|nr:hypothetical protein [Chlamydiota bacterium]MBI3277085.1 hypothetical protein [Chlamydiota bacterium]
MKMIKLWMMVLVFVMGSFAWGDESEDMNSQENVEQPQQAQERKPIERGRPGLNRPNQSDDIVLDYQGLVQQIDDMRRHEEDVMHQLEDLSHKYEDGLKKLEDTQKALDDELKDFKEWHDKAVEEMKKINQNPEPTHIKGEVRGAPNDRYTSGYPS